MSFTDIHGKFREGKPLLKFIIPITVALANYHINIDPLRREPVRESRAEVECDDEFDETTRARRLWTSPLGLETFAMAGYITLFVSSLSFVLNHFARRRDQGSQKLISLLRLQSKSV
jgi:hypothetical protein